tara:strand:- start:13 stop:369 length:357 start_codon:yes stop_codon:yes gene_type:complete
MYEKGLNKKDIIALNQQIGEKGEFNNESSLDFALGIAKTKRNWLYELSYVVKSLLVDHVFRDGNKRTAFLVVSYYADEQKRNIDQENLLTTVRKIAKNNITNPTIIMRLVNNVIKKKD